MKISYYTEERNLDKSVGYGNAGFQIVRSLQQLGHEVPYGDFEAPVQLWFGNPARAEFGENQYKIIYTPWESTSLPHGWLEAFNSADEVWGTSEWVADVYRQAGVTVPVHVYEHGINDFWKVPTKRERGDVLRFLHIGEPAPRKGGQMAFDAFREAFGDRDDVHLTLKAYHQSYVWTWLDGDVAKITECPNVSVLDKQIFETELRDLILEHDALIYPSYGEGFGLIPLQALVTGMPVVSTYEWAPYRHYVIPLEAQRFQSPWFFHPGKMYTPDYEHLVETYKYLDKEFEMEADFSFRSAPFVADDFNWQKKTEQAFAHIVERFTGN